MLIERFYHPWLAQASYLVACQSSGEALVVDPHCQIESYQQAASRAGVQIVAVAETHIHADFVSGARALARSAGAHLYLSAEGPAAWQYRYAAQDGAILLHHGNQLTIGRVVIDVLHTPGHTPEHLAFLVTDKAVADAPMGMLSGDFIFVGDVGRPDLLERAAGHAGTMHVYLPIMAIPGSRSSLAAQRHGPGNCGMRPSISLPARIPWLCAPGILRPTHNLSSIPRSGTLRAT